MNEIYLENSALSALNSLLSAEKNSTVFFLVDENTHHFCLPKLLEDLPDIAHFEILEIEAGEASKAIEVAANLWLALADLGADRNSVLVNVGGGVVTDLGGFIASTYKRGMRFCHVPTSLLAMTDAAVGGKTGIDVGGIKNLVGTFSFPEGTFVLPEFLETLPKNEMKSGFAEVLKHGLIADKKYWHQSIATWKNGAFKDVVQKSIAIKSEVVAADEKEGGLRKILNFGHTLGHAIESYFLASGNPVMHGEAVAAGMQMAAQLSKQKLGLPVLEAEEIYSEIAAIFPKLIWEENADAEILQWLTHDKKNKDGKLQFVLLKNIGEAVFNVEISLTEAAETLRHYREDAWKK